MKINRIMATFALLTVLLTSLGFAAGEQIRSGVCSLVGTVNLLLGAVVFVLIVLAAVVYAAGQVMGAETRARASVWATSMIVGAVIGIIIYIIVPTILGTMLGMTGLTAGMDETACNNLNIASG